ncbi:MAG: ISAs1 family transposase [Myxacorys californica WJT36-NPBG1]|jgi:predicted transposase YbfD/YdcC|nr:ISAs1 family transposase [Myxacorys californica WJT36-NPBG1]
MPCTPKKTVEQIIQSGNDYVITVKKNQPTLYQFLETQFAQQTPDSLDIQKEHTRGRVTQRIVSVLNRVEDIDAAWVGVQWLIRVERSGTRGAKPYHETMFYISSRPVDAADLSQRIRGHWQIENGLHWSKDVVLEEDTAPLYAGYAPANFAILRTMVMNLFRQHGLTSITQGLRRLAHDIPLLFSFFQ